METQTNVFSGQAHDQIIAERAATPEVAAGPLQTQAMSAAPAKQHNNNPATSAGLGVSEIVLRVFCTVFCVAVLIASAVALSAIDEVEDYLKDHDSKYENADNYRRAAKWLLLVAVMGCIFHSVMIFTRYLYLKSCVKSIFSIYAYLNAALCIVLGLSLFAGGVANVIYAANNAEAIDDISNICDQSNDITTDFCNAFSRVRDAETAAACMSFFTMVIFAVLVIIMISSGVIKQQGQDTESSSPTNDDLSSTSSHMSLNAPLYRPRDAPPPYTP